MSLGTIEFSPAAAVNPSGLTSNLIAPVLTMLGTGTDPKTPIQFVNYPDDGTPHYQTWPFRMPTDYVVGAGSIVARLHWQANTTTSSNVVFQLRLGAITSGDADTPQQHNAATAQTATVGVNTTEARRLNDAVITVTNFDSIAPGDYVTAWVFRDSSHASDTAAVAAELLFWVIEYASA